MIPRILHNRAVFSGQRVLFEIFYYVRITLRFLRLHLLSQWTQSAEEPKVVLYNHQGIALLQSIVDLAPLSIVIACMVLNIR